MINDHLGFKKSKKHKHMWSEELRLYNSSKYQSNNVRSVNLRRQISIRKHNSTEQSLVVIR